MQYFKDCDELADAVLMMELNGRWFYKEKGVNDREHGGLNAFANDMSKDDWDINYYFKLKSLSKVRLRFKPIVC